MTVRRLMRAIVAWLDERFQVTPLIEKNVTRKMIPKGLSYFGCFGGLALFTFLVQATTGMFLMMYYKPSPQEAFTSVQFIKHNVHAGWLIQRFHVVGANVMIVLVLLHMTRILYKRIYRSPRELHWVSGVTLLFLVTLMGFTGYLLPWTQLSYWGATVGTNMPGSAPIVGPKIVEFARGGKTISGVTLTRFYALHVAALPSIVALVMGLHFAMIRRTGISQQL